MLSGMTQERLGEILGVTFQQVQKYERGVNRIGAARLQEIASALQVPITSFYGDLDGASPESDTIPDEVASVILDCPESIRVLRAFAAIGNPRIQRQVMELLEVLSGRDSEG